MNRTGDYRDHPTLESVSYTPRRPGITYYEVSLRPSCYLVADATGTLKFWHPPVMLTMKTLASFSCLSTFLPSSPIPRLYSSRILLLIFPRFVFSLRTCPSTAFSSVVTLSNRPPFFRRILPYCFRILSTGPTVLVPLWAHCVIG